MPVPETHPTNPISEYGASKLAFEHYLSAYAARGLIEYAALRYAKVYGPRQRSAGEAAVVAVFARQMVGGEPVTIFGDGTKTRDYVYVGDVVEATLRAAAGPSRVVANVGWGKEVSDLELFRAVAAAAEYRKEPIFAADRPGDIARSCLDPALARRTWDWRASVPLGNGLRRGVGDAPGLAHPPPSSPPRGGGGGLWGLQKKPPGGPPAGELLAFLVVWPRRARVATAG